MRDDRDTGADALAEGELLDAYLDGETDELTTARLERRLADDPALAARLDALAATRARMQRLAQVSVPAHARQRLRDELRRERRAEPAPRVPDHRAAPASGRRPRHWTRRVGPFIAAAAIALVAIVGLASVLNPFVGADGAEESALAGDTAADAGDAAAPAAGEDAAPGEPDERVGAAQADGTDEAAEAEAGVPAAADVGGDAGIIARAQRLRDDPPADLGVREDRLRTRAGLSTDRRCVRDLNAVTVDLVDENGRPALAVLLADRDEILLLAPETCAIVRTITATP